MSEKQEHSLSPAWRAAAILRGRQEERSLNLQDASPEAIFEALGVSRARAYALARKLPEHLPQRGPGRPHNAPEPVLKELETLVHIAEVVRVHIVRHPGSIVQTGDRTQYSDTFRAFVLELMAPEGLATGLTRKQVAGVTGVREHTLNAWLYKGPRKLRKAEDAPEPTPQSPESDGSSWSGDLEKVLTLWESWRGNLTDFCAAVKEQGMDLSRTHIEQVLFAADKRKRKPRNRHQIDAEAVREAIERFFPNAQVAVDGKYIALTIDDATERFCWQLVTDVHTGAFLGIHIGDEETGAGMLAALGQAGTTAGGPPLAVLRDNRQCNISKAVEEALSDKDVMSMTSRKGRPQTNGTTEGGFSLFTQSMPDISLDTSSRRELARAVMEYVLTAFCAGRNQAPRRRSKAGSKAGTAAEDFQTNHPDEQERKDAAKRLAELHKRARRTRKDHNRRREQPAVRKVMTELLAGLGVDEPRKGTLDKLANLGLDAATEAGGIVLAKVDNGLKLDGDPQRYLLKIAINVANRNEDIAAFHHTVRLRDKAGELLLDPLRAQDADLRTTLNDTDYIAATAAKALAAHNRIDRYFWWELTIRHLVGLSNAHRTTQARLLAQKVATRYSLHYRERDALIGQLAKASAPLPGGM